MLMNSKNTIYIIDHRYACHVTGCYSDSLSYMTLMLIEKKKKTMSTAENVANIGGKGYCNSLVAYIWSTLWNGLRVNLFVLVKLAFL